MANDQRLSSAAEPDGLDKAYASAKKALSLTGIDMDVKKPDAAKVSAKMTKTKKPAEFMLSYGGGKVTLSIECGGATVAELGQMSIDIAKGGKTALAVLDGLVAAKLVTKAEAETLKAGTRSGPDPKVVANELRKKANELHKKIADIKTEMAANAKIKSYDDAKRDKSFFAELLALAKSEHSEEGLDFLAEVEKKTKRDKIIEQFIGKKAKDQVNLSDILVGEILAGGNFDAAVKEVKDAVAKDTLTRCRNNIANQYKKDLGALEAELKALD